MSCSRAPATSARNSWSETFEQLAHLGRINLRPPHVAVGGLVFRVDGDRQRLDRVHVQIGDLFDVLELFGLRARDFADSLLVETIEKMNQA